jgi:hypothetical protein
MHDESRSSLPKPAARKPRPWSLDVSGLESEENKRLRRDRAPFTVTLSLMVIMFSGLILLDGRMWASEAHRHFAIDLNNYVIESRHTRGGLVVVFDNERRVRFPWLSVRPGLSRSKNGFEAYDHVHKSMDSYNIYVNGEWVYDGAWVHERQEAVAKARWVFFAAISTFAIDVTVRIILHCRRRGRESPPGLGG